MDRRNILFLLALTLLLPAVLSGLACGTRANTRVPTGTPPANLDLKQIRALLQSLGGANLSSQQVELKSIFSGVGADNTVVEARIETAFRLARSGGEWKVAEIRLGDRQWESVELLETALRREKERRTTAMLKRLADGLEAYRRDKGQWVVAAEIAVLLDHLSPQYLSEPLRFDWWGTQFVYRGMAANYQLSSAGADRKPGTADDLVIENGALRAQAQ